MYNTNQNHQLLTSFFTSAFFAIVLNLRMYFYHSFLSKEKTISITPFYFYLIIPGTNSSPAYLCAFFTISFPKNVSFASNFVKLNYFF